MVGAWIFPIRNAVKMLRVLKKVTCSRWSSQFYMFFNIFQKYVPNYMISSFLNDWR